MMNRSTVFQLSCRPSFKLMMGIISALGVASSLILPEIVQAQSPAEMDLYTQIAIKIERQRRKDFAEVKQLMGGNVPENVCQQGSLPQQARKVCDSFDSTSRDIITSSGMSITKFNEITRFCQQSPKPKECPK